MYAPLTLEEKETLLGLARDTIQNVLNTTPMPDVDAMPDTLKMPRACFVSLYHSVHLCGCVGSVFPQHPLVEDVQRNAIHAAFGDPRFPPLVGIDALRTLQIEISVLTPPMLMRENDDFELGVDGIAVRYEKRMGALLPQRILVEGWDHDMARQEACRNAHLPLRAWEVMPCEFYKFKVEVFRDKI